MAVLEVLHYGDPVLQQTAKPVDNLTKEDLTLIKDMTETMYKTDGVGIAAPQVGVSKRIFIIDVKQVFEKGKKEAIVFVNPEILEESDEDESGSEGCLSVPGIQGDVYRYNKIKVRAYDINFKKFEIVAEGFMARVIQHETDHLNGCLFIDRLGKVKRTMIAGQVRQIRQNTEKKLNNM